jgi:hypothetical protein
MSISLQEYSEKLIKGLVDKFKDSADERTVRNLIQTFDRVKDALATKKGVVIPDRLKDGNKFKDITLYTFDELANLVRTLPVDEKKLKADAVAYYTSSEKIDPGTAKSYVDRFFRNKAELKAMVKGSDEEEKKAALAQIPKKLQSRDLFTDIKNWSDFGELERMLDSLFPLKGSDTKDDSNDAETDADKIYSNGGVEIYIGDQQHKCINYGKGNYYKWCVVQTEPNNMYFNYRFSQYGENRMFYIVIDRNRSDKKKSNGTFEDQWHAFVIHIGEKGTYWVTGADNRVDQVVKSWDEIGGYIPADIWSKIKGLKDSLKFIKPTQGEILSQALKGKKLSVSDFNELPYEEKRAYIRTNSPSNIINSELFAAFDNELKNLAINSGRKTSYEELKDSPALAKRYAITRSRHEDYGKMPIPLPFIKYLDNNGQREYLKKFEEDYLDYDALEKFFDKDIVKDYVSDKVKNLDYLPKDAKKYMDAKEKALYDMYSIPFTDTNLRLVDDKTIESGYDVPVRTGTIFSTSYKSFKDIESKVRENYIKMLKTLMKDKSNLDKYGVLFMGVPITFNINNKLYFFAPVEKGTTGSVTKQEYCFYDEDGNVKIKGLSNYLDVMNGDKQVKKTSQGVVGNSSIYINDNDFTGVILKDKDGGIKKLSKEQLTQLLTK